MTAVIAKGFIWAVRMGVSRFSIIKGGQTGVRAIQARAGVLIQTSDRLDNQDKHTEKTCCLCFRSRQPAASITAGSILTQSSCVSAGQDRITQDQSDWRWKLCTQQRTGNLQSLNSNVYLFVPFSRVCGGLKWELMVEFSQSRSVSLKHCPAKTICNFHTPARSQA